MMIKVMMMTKTDVNLHVHNHLKQKLTIMDPNPPWLKEGYQRNHGSCSEQFATSFATMMSTHCAHNAPPTQPSNGLSLPLRMILDHSAGKCVHQIDISVRCIDEMQKGSLLQIQFYCQPLCISGVRAAMPDKRVA